MGIRYNRDTHRATNGPMIFFSDPSAEIDLADEIRGAISSQLSFYAYRRPGDMMISFGSSEGYVDGIGVPGFVISPFDPTQSALTIPYSPSKDMIRSATIEAAIPKRSTTEKEHESEIALIQKKLLNYADRKIVAARVIVEEGGVDVGASFCNLCHRYPSAFVYAFSTPKSGCWIGASPELLLETSGNGISTMSLAGTRPAGTQNDWDEKNIEEQRIVTEYILHTLQSHGFEAVAERTYPKEAGSVEHICTPIVANTSTLLSCSRLQSLLTDLSPTPALCGRPKDIALATIREGEHFDRGFYGGFCGQFRASNDFNFYVNLRCSQVEAAKYALYVGGGITLKSIPYEEWEETEMKASTLKSCLILDSL